MRDFAKIFRDDEGRQMLAYVDPGAGEDEQTILHCMAQRDGVTFSVKFSFPDENDAYRSLDRMDEGAANALTAQAEVWDPKA